MQASLFQLSTSNLEYEHHPSAKHNANLMSYDLRFFYYLCYYLFRCGNMIFKKLKIEDTKSFCDLIVDMYSHLDNIEWFSPMPFDYDNVKSIIEKPRFYILGAFDKDFLCAVSSLDYKCGKLIGKIDFPKECDTNKLVEFGFTMVHSNYRGQGIMKKLVAQLIDTSKKQGLEWAFGKVHKDNLASSTSLIRNGFEKKMKYNKPVKVADIKQLLADKVLSKTATNNIIERLSRISNEEFINADYDILIKKL